MGSRRKFLALLGTLPLAAKGVISNNVSRGGAGAHRFTGNYGLQLYSLRSQLARDVPGTLAYIRKIGFGDVETAGLYGLSPEKFRAYLDQSGLKSTSMHVSGERLESEIEAVLHEASTLGVQYVVCSSVNWERRNLLDMNDYRQIAGLFNKWGKRVRAEGFGFGYHNHDFEFRVLEGRPALDILIGNTDPRLVDFEMDVFWVRRGGQDPVEYLKRYGSRFRLMHLKDMRRGTPVGDLSVGISDEASVPLGEGMLDIKGILRASANIKHYYVEDESAEAPEGIRASLKYLKAVRF